MKKQFGKIIFLFLFAIFASQFLNFQIPTHSQNLTDTEEAEEETKLSNLNLHQWGAISLFHGLPSDRVRAITQDSEGVIWFGTDSGLAKYDGRRVQTVAAEGLSGEKIFSLKFDENETLWIGSSSGAYKFSDERFSQIKETDGKTITDILITKDKRVILGTEEGIIFEISEKGENSDAVESFPEKPLIGSDAENALKFTSIAEQNGWIIAGTLGRGLMSFENGELKQVPSNPYFINALEINQSGKISIGTPASYDKSGLYTAENLSLPEKSGVATGTVLSLKADLNADLWIGTQEKGAYLFRSSENISHFTFENTAGGLRSNNIYTIFIDRENVVWFGTDKGISRFDANSPFNEKISDDANSNFVRTFFESRNGQIYAGTNRGLFVYDANFKRWQTVENFPLAPIYSVNEDEKGNLLVGSKSGFFGDSDLNDEKITDGIRSVENFRGKTYLAIFGKGLEQIGNESRNQMFPQNSSSQFIKCLYAENDKRLWIGTVDEGVLYFDGEKITAEPAFEQLQAAGIWAIAGTLEKGIWIATGRGLHLYQNGKLNLIGDEVAVRDVFSDGEKVWAATENGVFQYKFNNEFGWLASKMDVEQGLPSQNIFAVLPLRENGVLQSVLIGTNRGTAKYQPNNSKPLLIPTRILSKRLHTANELSGGINLDYPQNTLTLEVTALSSRTFPEQFQYSFLLKDAAGKIVEKKFSNEAVFLMENLPPGVYSAQARALDNDLNFSRPLQFNFTVAKAPFPWTSAWLAVLLFFALVALIWAIFERFQIVKTSDKLAKTNKELTTARLDLANEAERERRRIARDLHDQTLADLRKLMLLTDKLPAPETSEADLEANAFRNEIETVSEEIRRICEDLSPSVLENVGLTAALEWLLITHAAEGSKTERFEYEFVCDEKTEDNLDLSTGEQMQIYRIAQEVLNNICRHAEAEFVRMFVSNSLDSGFVLQIENDGRVFDAENAKKGRGLSNIKSRANLIEAEVFWTKGENGKMIFALRRKS